MASDPSSLPSALDIRRAVASEDEDQCRSLVLRCLRFGTTSAASKEGGEDDDLPSRRDECCRVLLEAFKIAPTTEDGPSDLDDALLRHALVDGLWLVSTSLVQSATTTTTAGGGDDETSDPLLDPSIQSLLYIVRSLLRGVEGQSRQKAVSSTTASSSSSSFAHQLQSNLYPILTDALGLTSSVGGGDDLMKRLRMHNTQMNYKQQKYNLLQEESEGYAKLLRCLQDTVVVDVPSTDDGKSTPASSSRTVVESSDLIMRLVGGFELDPNRAVDLALDVLEEALHSSRGGVEDHAAATDVRPLLSIVRSFPQQKIASLIHFKLQNDAAAAGGGGTEETKTTQRLRRTVAFLVREGVVDLRTLMQYLGPVGDVVQDAYKAFWTKEKAKIVSLTRISLTGGGSQNFDAKQAELQRKYQELMLPLEKSPTLSILLLLIQDGMWDAVKPLLSADVWSHLCCLIPRSFGSALCDVAYDRVDDWYGRIADRPNLYESEHRNGNQRSKAGSSGRDASEASEDDVASVVQSLWDPLSCTLQSGCISRRPDLFCEICRLLRTMFRAMNVESDIGYHSPPQVYAFFSGFLVPSVSLFPSNPAVSTELWSVLQYLPYPTRYKIYSEWKGLGLGRGGMSSTSGGKPLPNVLSEVEAGKAARYVLKRLSKENIRDMSRQLAKVTHANPLVVYATILDQIESYDNMVEVMVEAQRFVNPLGLDVLGYCILGRLSGSTGGVNRSRLKEDGLNVSQWLQSLETFTGEFYKRRPFVEIRGILSYLMRRLKDGHVMELGILRTLLKVAGGYNFADYSPAASLNENQLYGRAGSLTLKRETMSFGIVEQTNPRATHNIRKLLQADSRGVALLILIAQARDRILFDAKRGSPKNIKLAGNLYDSCQVVMAILVEFLTTEDAWGDGTPEMVLDTASTSYLSFLPSLKDLHTIFGLDFDTAWYLSRPASKLKLASEAEGDQSPHGRFELTADVREAFSDCLPDDLYDHLTPKLLEFFQVNCAYDLFFPDKIYSAEKDRVDKELEGIQSTNPSSSIQDIERLERLQALSNQLEKDAEAQKEHVTLTLKELDEEKSCFFVSEDVSQEAARLFLMCCIYPRSLQSPDDAVYSSAFAFHLHKVWTPGFSTIHFLDEMVSLVAGTLFGLTEGEAANVACLLWQSWKIVSKWRYEEGVFDKEVLGKPGSQVVEISHGDKTSKSVSYHDFTKLYQKWHSVLGTALIGCLTSHEYMHIRTGLLILTRLVDVFPTRPSLGTKVLQALSPLQDENTSRPDIRAAANAYGMMLLKARDEGKWIEEDEAEAKARADKEVAAAKERKKKLEQSFQELERESEKITAEIGPRDRYDRRRDFATPRGTAQEDAEGGRQPIGRGMGQSNGRSNDLSRAESGELHRSRDDRDYRPSREEEHREREFRSDDRGRGRAENGEWRRDGGSMRDDRRWQRDAPSGRSTKRSRPSSPESDHDLERSNAKRPRLDVDNYPSRRNAGGRSDPSPPPQRSRRDSPDPPPRSRPRRVRR